MDTETERVSGRLKAEKLQIHVAISIPGTTQKQITQVHTCTCTCMYTQF